MFIPGLCLETMSPNDHNHSPSEMFLEAAANVFHSCLYSIRCQLFLQNTQYIYMAFQTGAEVENKDLLFSTRSFSGMSSEITRIRSRRVAFSFLFFALLCFAFLCSSQTRNSRSIRGILLANQINKDERQKVINTFLHLKQARKIWGGSYLHNTSVTGATVIWGTGSGRAITGRGNVVGLHCWVNNAAGFFCH